MHLMRVIKRPRSDSEGSCVNKNVRDNKGFYSSTTTTTTTTTTTDAAAATGCCCYYYL